MQQVLPNDEETTTVKIHNESEASSEEEEEENKDNESAYALKTYLNRIPISSFPDFIHSPVMEVKAGDSVRDAVEKLHEKNASVALISDISPDNSSHINKSSKPSDIYIGVINFTTILLWCFQWIQEDGSQETQRKEENQPYKGFFSMLQDNPHINQTKVGELAKSFLWNPFFPVYLEDSTLFHVLLLLSKHRLNIVPVIERSKYEVIGFITENAVVKFLLGSSGLEWFDNIANATLSEFRYQFKKRDGIHQVYADQSIREALLLLYENRIGVVAVIDHNTKEIIGTVKESDIMLLLDNDKLFANAKTTSVSKLMKTKSHKDGLKTLIKSELRQVSSAGAGRFCVGNNLTLRTDSLIVHKETNTLKEVMEKMAESNEDSSFLVDELWRVIGMISTRDIIVEFAPPCVDSSLVGGGFFESALQLTGCHFENGTLVSDT